MKNISLAIIDTHELFRQGVIYSLSGYKKIETIISVSSDAELINQINNTNSFPDVCLVDLSMPIINGCNIIASIKSDYPYVHILPFLPYSNEFSIFAVLKSGASGFLTKDISTVELKRAITLVVKNGYYHSKANNSFIKSIYYGSEKLKITLREREFIINCCTELQYDEIARKMNVSKRTIESYRDSLFSKLKIKSRTSLVIFAIQSGLVTLNKLQASD